MYKYWNKSDFAPPPQTLDKPVFYREMVFIFKLTDQFFLEEFPHLREVSVYHCLALVIQGAQEDTNPPHLLLCQFLHK